MVKIVTVIMGQNCEKFIGMCLDGVKNSDAIVYCDGGSTDGTLDIIAKKKGWIRNKCKNKKLILTHGLPCCEEHDIGKVNTSAELIENEYNQKDKEMNGKQRNFYLDYVKKHYPDYWCLCLDADEVVEDFDKLKIWIDKYGDSLVKRHPCISVKMKHFIGDLGHEDATQKEHFVLNRLFKINDDLHYPEVEHPVLQYKNEPLYQDNFCRETTIFHLAYIPNLFEIVKRYNNHIKKSNMHTPEFLDDWKDAHILGLYPTSKVNIMDIPDVILNYFKINKDKYYFKNRGIGVKHSMMVKQWYEYFEPDSVLALGCGRGPYLYYWDWFVIYAHGMELSEWAVKNAFVGGIGVGDISKEEQYLEHDLITAIDVLEHLNDDQLDKTLKNMSKYGKRFLFSIPFDKDDELDIQADPNLYNDNTHLQFKSKREWIQLIESFGITIQDTPKEWLYSNQLLVGEKK